MKDIHYSFVELDSPEAFELLGRSFQGVLKHHTLHFDNHIAKGNLVKANPDPGLWIRKWKLTVFEKLMLHKLPSPDEDEKKFMLVYFLNPAIFSVRNMKKKIRVNGCHNSLFLTSGVTIDFTVVPKQPFYVLDIAFSVSWLLEHFNDAYPSFKNIIFQYIKDNAKTVLTEACSVDEYKTLHELDVSMLDDEEDVLFLRSRVYNLIVSMLTKIVNRKEIELIRSTVNYEQLIQAETIITENMKRPPKIEAIARRVNMSVSSLLRQFKLIYGKSIYEYHVEKKMELAKKMILEDSITVKQMAEILGYNQASPFIEGFTKYHGYSPGRLKLLN